MLLPRPSRSPNVLLLTLFAFVGCAFAQTIGGVTFTTTTAPGSSVPVFSATSLPPFTPTATGAAPGAGTVVTIINSGNGETTGSNPIETFVYTVPYSSVPPTGDIQSIGLTGSVSNLIPDSTNLRRASAERATFNRATFVSGLAVALLGMGGAAWVLI